MKQQTTFELNFCSAALALLHYAIFLATCPPTPLQNKLLKKSPVTIRNFLSNF